MVTSPFLPLYPTNRASDEQPRVQQRPDASPPINPVMQQRDIHNSRNESYHRDAVATAAQEGANAFTTGKYAVDNLYLEDMNNTNLRLSNAWHAGWTDAMWNHVRTGAPGSWVPLPLTFEEVSGNEVNPGSRPGRAIDLGE